MRPPQLALLVLAALTLPAPSRAACPAGMAALPGGGFAMADGRPAAVAPYCLDRTEVTVAAYARCVAAGACAAERLDCGPAATWGRKDGNLPVNCVDWHEAEAFCRAHGKRLPTEVEWEWAARGGARARTYPWGEAPPGRRACWDGEGNAAGKGERKAPCRVASHPGARSADGLEDLAGNVREWTSTVEEERYRVLRGGAWGDSLPAFLAAGFRGWNVPEDRMEHLGFRCAAAPGTRSEAPQRLAQVQRREDGVVEVPLLVGARRR